MATTTPQTLCAETLPPRDSSPPRDGGGARGSICAPLDSPARPAASLRTANEAGLRSGVSVALPCTFELSTTSTRILAGILLTAIGSEDRPPEVA